MKKCFTVLTLFWLSIFLVQAQQTVTGTVKDNDGVTLPGVTVSEKGATNAVSTNANGTYTIVLKDANSTLTFSFIGFLRQEVAINNRSVVNVSLVEDTESLEEVVIVGYQKQSMRKTTSSVQIVTGAQIENLPAPSFESLLQGRVSGLNIQNFTGEPGARNTFTIRGNTTISPDLNSEIDLANTMSSPLYVIDGMPMSMSDLSGSSATGTNYIAGINLNDIESIVVQKDAAATAVWGSRGANGVIVIKTKQGLSGKPSVRLSYYSGVTQRPELQLTYAGAQERRQKMGLIKEYGNFVQLSNIPQILTDSLNPSFNNATDWQELFYSTGRVSNYDISISAGSDIINYRLSLNFYDEDGIVRNTGFKRYALRGNFDFKLFPVAQTSLIVAASRMDRKRGLGRGINEIVPINASSMPASFIKLTPQDYEFYYGQYDKLRDDNQTDALSIFSQTDIDLYKGLSYSLQASAQATMDRRDQFQPTEIAANNISFASGDRYDLYTYNLTNILNYGKTFNEDHTFTLTGIQSFEYNNQKRTYVLGYNVPTDDIQVVQGIAQRDLRGQNDLKDAALLSFLGQFAYDYKAKYMMNASWRADASSRFGKNTKWGYFPALSASWIASDEGFLKDVEWLSLLKVRGSWGESGTLPQDFYAPYNVWNLSSTTYDGKTIATPSFSKPLTLPNLTWNKSSQINIGGDLSVFDSRLNITADVYRKETKDPIMSFEFPFYTGYTRLSYNVPMTILNEGLDLSINSRNLKKESPFQWSTNLNVSINKNRIGSLPNGNRGFYADSYGYNQQLLYTVGSPIYRWAQMEYQGVYNNIGEIPVNPITGQRITYFKGNYPVQPGFPIWNDVNKDWDVWGDEDKGAADGDLVPTGDPNPRITGGLYNEVSWKSFSLSILGVFTFKRDIINTYMSNQYNGVWNFGGINNFAGQRLPDYSNVNPWSPSKAEDPNFQAGFPSLSPYGPNYYQFLPFTTLWNENGNYFKIKTINFGYRFNENIINKAGIGLKDVRLYTIIDNIHSFQSSSVPDAELVTPQGEYSGGAYPLPTKVTFGIEVKF